MNATSFEGRKIKRIREILGIKQTTLAADVNKSQQWLSEIEQSETVEPEIIDLLAKAMHVPAEAIKNFDDEAAFNFISTTFTSHDNSTSIAYKSTLHFNPIEKVMEVMEENKKLYEKLLIAEKEKVALFEKYFQ